MRDIFENRRTSSGWSSANLLLRTVILGYLSIIELYASPIAIINVLFCSLCFPFWSYTVTTCCFSGMQKQPFKGVPRKRCSESISQIYRRTPMVKCDFNKVAFNFIKIALRHGCSPVNLLHIFRTLVYKNNIQFCNIHRKTPVLESLFNKVACIFIKKRLQHKLKLA